MTKETLIVDEYTTPNPDFVYSTDSLQTVCQVMKKAEIRHVLVKSKSQKIVGILSQRDVTTFSQASNFHDIIAENIMSKDIFTVPPDAKLYEVALRMSSEKIGSAVIQDPDNDYIGIFTATDALNALVEVLRGDTQ